MQKRAITKTEGEAFPHIQLWRCAKKQYKQAQLVKKGRFYFDICAILMAYLTYEAYINFVGDRLDPDIWEDEKNFFNQKDYYGIEGKLKRIKELCGNFEIDNSSRPYQTIKKMGRFRTDIVHAKTRKYEKIIEHNADHEQNLWPESAFPEVNEKLTERVLEDTEAFIEYLHKKIKLFVKDHWVGDKALQGLTGYSGSETKLKD